MHEDIESLRKRIDGVAAGAGGRRAFTAAIRKDVVELAGRWEKMGRGMQALADALSLHPATISNWRGRSSRKRAKTIRPVAVAAQPEPSRPRKVTQACKSELVMVMPSGVRIEGLALSDVLQLASALG